MLEHKLEVCKDYKLPTKIMKIVATIFVKLLQNEVQLNINRALDKKLWNRTRLLMIINYEIKVIKWCTTATEQERAGKNAINSEEQLSGPVCK